jgi:putative Holliday junction resolvase
VDNHNPQEFLGVDVGESRIGLARGSSLARIAEPLKTLSAKDAIAQIAAVAKQNNSAAIVVGLPRNLSGAETLQTKTVRGWTAKAKSQIDLPFYWQDEALTSSQAEKEFSGKRGDIDAIAASIILQDFLNTPNDQRKRA